MSKKPTQAETIARLKSILDQANGRIAELRAQRDAAFNHAEELAGENAALRAARSPDIGPVAE